MSNELGAAGPDGGSSDGLNPEASRLLRAALGDEVFEAGLAFVAVDQVRDVQSLQQGQVNTGLVLEQGAEHRVYIQRQGANIDGECSCDVSENCAHVAAVLIKHLSEDAQVAKPRAQPRTQQIRADKTRQLQQRICYLLTPIAAPKSLLPQNVGINITAYIGGFYQDKMADFQPYNQRQSGGNYPRYVDTADQQILPILKTAPGVADASLLAQCLETGRSYWQDLKAVSLKVDEKPDVVNRGAWRIKPDGCQEFIFSDADETQICFDLRPPIYIQPASGQWGRVKTDPAFINILLRTSELRPEDLRVFNLALQGLKLDDIPAPYDLKLESIEPQTIKAKLVLGRCEHLAEATLFYLYNGFAFASHVLSLDRTELRYLQGHTVCCVQRNLLVEQQLRQRLTDFRPGISGLVLGTDQAWLSFVMQELPKLQDEGWQIEIQEDFPYQVTQNFAWYGQLATQIETQVGTQGKAVAGANIGQANDWFNLSFGILIDGQEVNLLPALVAQLQLQLSSSEAVIRSGLTVGDQLLLKLPSGSYAPVAIGRVQEIVRVLVELYENAALDEDGQLAMQKNQLGRLAALQQAFDEPDDGLAWSGEEAALSWLERWRDFEAIEPLDPPTSFKATLRTYQAEGLGWLQFLRQYQTGGILADDMGLGKTIQTLAHLCIEKQAGRLTDPALIVAPTSLIANWRQEAEKFAPNLAVLVLHGSKRHEHYVNLSQFDVVITSYTLVNIDAERLLAQAFYYLILDEAQVIKNPRAKITKLVADINAEHRLCLSGTPMENHLGELWSLFNFAEPGFLGDERSFHKQYRVPIEEQGDIDRSLALSKRIAPFILRRHKSDVMAELPAKTEILRKVSLGEAQQSLYDSVRLTMHEQIREVIQRQGMASSHIAVLDALLKLRQICCDPRLLPAEIERTTNESAKFDLLMDMLPGMIEAGRRILVFSQFTSMLALIETALTEQSIQFAKLTGRTRNREAEVNRFQNGEVSLFLISLKAGGTGLNLTAADVVIHFDPWWNPAAENQATDRAHRIGQDKPVFVYKLITEGTVEEKILALQARKKSLADGLYDAKTASPTRLKREDIEALFEAH